LTSATSFGLTQVVTASGFRAAIFLDRLHPLLEGRLVSSQRPQFDMQLFQHGMREAGADVARVAPLRAIAQGYNRSTLIGRANIPKKNRYFKFSPPWDARDARQRRRNNHAITGPELSRAK
jgi:hypothetical protein